MRRNLLVNEVLGDFAIAGGSASPLRYLKLPAPFTGRQFELCARDAGVQVYGAERFAVGNKQAEAAVRIAVTTPPTMDDLTQGIKRLRKLLEQG